MTPSPDEASEAALWKSHDERSMTTPDKDTTHPDADGCTPRHLPGGIYCSPFCGFGCTKVGHDRAIREAELLCEELGDGWKPRVWENRGWNYQAEKGPARVHVNTVGDKLDATYTVTTYTAEIVSGDDRYQLWPHREGARRDPREAVAYILAVARQRSDAILSAIAEIEL